MTDTAKPVQLDRRGRVAVLTVDNPPVNALSHAVRLGLSEGLRAAAGDPAAAAIAIVCAGRTFIAGADITEFGKPPREPGLADVLDLIEGNPKPVVAGIHGTALGGGLEVALACHYRVGVKTARFGLPEVKLGLLPGAGGTQRLPRVVGVETALQMIVSGDPIGADDALRTGSSTRSSRATSPRRRWPSPSAWWPRGARCGRSATWTTSWRRPAGGRSCSPSSASRWRGTTRGFRAPERCIQAVEAAVSLPFDAGPGAGARALPRAHELARVAGPALLLLRRARGGQDPRRAAHHGDRRGAEGGGDRRRDDGRRHRHELRQRRHPGHGGRGQPRGARPGPRRRAEELRGDGGPGPALGRRAGAPARAHPGQRRLRRRGRRRPGHRGGVRGDAGEEGGLRPPGRPGEAGRRPRHQHLDAERRRDRRARRSGRSPSSACTSSARPT